MDRVKVQIVGLMIFKLRLLLTTNKAPHFHYVWDSALPQRQNGPEGVLIVPRPFWELKQWRSDIGHSVAILSFIVYVHEA